MLFNSLAYLAFFPAVTLLYFLLPHAWRPVHLLLASCFFYAAFVPAYLLVLGFTILIDYAAGLLIEPARGRRRTAWLALSILANVGVLATFKYYNFFAGNVNELLHALVGRPPALPLLDVLLPIGLSFHTFQAMSYTIEVYRGRQPAERHPGMYALYVMFFPQLVAGPIERPQQLLPQFRERHAFRYDDATHGLRLILWGMFKKVVIADRLALFTDPVFNDPRAYSPVVLLLAAFFFSFQIFCDFSGYSDIAVGSARVMGFRLMQNFDRPYAARTVAGFWTRWHVSLSSWLRDYVYIPLGGNRHGERKQYLYLFLTMLIGGFWHGASWKFVFWGAMHGAGLVVHKLFVKYTRGRGAGNPVAGLLGWLVTFHFVALLWVFFRAESFGAAWQIIGKAVLETEWRYLRPFLETRGLLCGVMALGFAVHFVPEAVKQNLAWAYYTFSATTKAVILILIIQLILQVQTEDVQPFIYFQF